MSGPRRAHSELASATRLNAPLTSLSVFFPAHNEAGNIERVVASALEVCAPLADRLEVIVVDDGSTDETAGCVRNLADSDPRVKLVQHPVNRGYGGALKSGMAAATGDFVFFTDGDGQFDIAEIGQLVPLIEAADLVVGYRMQRSDPWYRLVNARLYHWLIQIMFGLKLKDIDCAFKLFHRRVLEGLRLESEGALISAEFLLRARSRGCRIEEIGVHHYPRRWGRATGASVRVILRMFLELFRFRLKLWREKLRGV